MTPETIITIAIIAALICGLCVLVYLYVRNKTLEEIRTDVYQLFLYAEHTFLSGEGKQKMDYVIQSARMLLPPAARFFVTEELLRKVVQMWFDAIKDLLDDGKYNGSVKEQE